MKIKNQTDHIALLALMMSGTIVKRMNELDLLDDGTKNHLHKLVNGVRVHAEHRDIQDLQALFCNLERSFEERV